MPEKTEQVITRWKCGHCGFLYDNQSSAENCEKRGERNIKFLNALVPDTLMWYQLKSDIGNRLKWILAFEYQEIIQTPNFYFGDKNCFHKYVVLYDINSNDRPNSFEYEVVQKFGVIEAFQDMHFMPNWNYITKRLKPSCMQPHIQKQLEKLWGIIQGYVRNKCGAATLEQLYKFTSSTILKQYVQHSYNENNPCVFGPDYHISSLGTWNFEIPDFSEKGRQ